MTTPTHDDTGTAEAVIGMSTRHACFERASELVMEVFLTSELRARGRTTRVDEAKVEGKDSRGD